MTNFLAELRRRNVFRVAAAYLVVGWVLIQVTSLAIPALHLPGWTDTLVFFLILLGLPVALLLAWAFEMTPEGMKPTVAVPDGVSIAPQTGKQLDYVIVAALVVVVGLIGWQQIRPNAGTPHRPEGAMVSNTASVAVLPFIDLSPEGDQEYFSDGISEEILNVLVRVPGLGVAGRTSSFAFKGRNEDLREIGASLGVDHVLEGSVRRHDNQLRITAQLIRSSDGFHVWSETYDRELDDIFQIQDDIAGAVANALAISLGIDWQSAAHDRTDDIEAYELYLRARQLYLMRGFENLDTATLLLQEVVARDPDYAPGWTLLAGVYSVLESYALPDRIDQYHNWRSIGLAAARRAAELDPESGEAQAYIANFLSWSHDWVDAFQAYDRAVELAPQNASVLDTFAQTLTDVGLAEEAHELALRAVSIDPLVPIHLNTLGWSEHDRPGGGIDVALESFRRASELNPALPFPYSNAIDALIGAGRRDDAEQIFDAWAGNVDLPAETENDTRGFYRAWREGDEALAAFAVTNPQSRYFVALVLDDMDMLMESLIQAWADEPQSSLALFANTNLNYRNDPRWRQHIREIGLLPLWKVRGFPPGCQALGTDDFECEAQVR